MSTVRNPSRDECDKHGWDWCGEHDRPLYHGNRPCFLLHAEAAE